MGLEGFKSLFITLTGHKDERTRGCRRPSAWEVLLGGLAIGFRFSSTVLISSGRFRHRNVPYLDVLAAPEASRDWSASAIGCTKNPSKHSAEFCAPFHVTSQSFSSVFPTNFHSPCWSNDKMSVFDIHTCYSGQFFHAIFKRPWHGSLRACRIYGGMEVTDVRARKDFNRKFPVRPTLRRKTITKTGRAGCCSRGSLSTAAAAASVLCG